LAETRTWRRRLGTLAEILLALGLPTDYLAASILPPFPSVPNQQPSVKALAAFLTLSSLLFLALLAILQRIQGESLFGFLGPGSRLGREALRGLLCVPAIFAAAYLLKSFFRHATPMLYSGEKNVLEEMMRGPGDLALFLFASLLAGGIKEEFQRAFVIRRFEAGWGPAWVGALLYAAWFGYGHLLQGIDEAIIAGLVGLAWGLLFIARKSVAAPVVSHGLYDALELIRYYFLGPLRYF
jgi:membrane protease YdiL (CAAX protease family)